LYQSPSKADDCTLKSWRYYAGHALVLAFFVYFTIIGIRGGFGAYTRPITLSNANEYVNKGNEAAIVLNTPFCIYRTIGKKVYKDPKYFNSIEEAAAVCSPIRQFQKSGEMNKMNVVVMILESFGKENFGFFNKHLDGGTYKGYTPFLDSLMGEGLTFKYSYSNGRKSIDGMPSVLSSIPMFIEPFILTPYSTNSISSIADVLCEEGYYTAFFHSAPNGSMGFQAYAKAAGFQDYFGMTEYGNDKDFDGTWGIWDEEFLQFYAKKMNEFRKPFATSIFTVSSHHPFNVPERYKDKFPKGDRPIHQCIGYSDNALRLFFKTMSQYDWFENTLFVITADHTNQISHEEYHTDANIYAVPVLFYHPGSNLKGFKEDVLAQQIDIMPSVLSYLNYGKPFFSFGDDVIYGADKDKYVINYSNQIYQLYQGDWLLQFDGVKTKALYRFKEDVMLKNNLKDSNPDVVKKMETIVKANIQQYIHRMLNDELTAKP
jgi:phosphoglycerol transferase MdoB-like AlkP superfamily enzyme